MTFPLTLGTNPSGEPVSIPLDTLRRHVVVLGASGSGKTVACKVLVEECVRYGLPIVAVDPQGDLASLALMGDLDALLKMGVDPAIAHKYREKCEPVIWTPGSSCGVPLNVSPPLDFEGLDKEEDLVRATGAVAYAIAEMLGYNVQSEGGECVAVGLGKMLEYSHRAGILLEGLGDLAALVGDPPLSLLEEVEEVLPEKDRAKVVRRIKVKLMGANRMLFDMGEPIDCDRLFGFEEGGPVSRRKARVSIIYLNTLNSFEEKELFVAMLANAMYQWMIKASPVNPVGLLYLDEVAPYMPPVKKPVAKEPLMLLLRQARKYGLCMLLATQSPGDLDYKALGQIGTWLLGRMTTGQDAAKIAPALSGTPGLDVDALLDSLPGLAKGQFYLVCPDVYEGAQEVAIRWLVTQHKVLTPEQVERLGLTA